jgi:hypothetical protein
MSPPDRPTVSAGHQDRWVSDTFGVDFDTYMGGGSILPQPKPDDVPPDRKPSDSQGRGKTFDERHDDERPREYGANPVTRGATPVQPVPPDPQIPDPQAPDDPAPDADPSTEPADPTTPEPEPQTEPPADPETQPATGEGGGSLLGKIQAAIEGEHWEKQYSEPLEMPDIGAKLQDFGTKLEGLVSGAGATVNEAPPEEEEQPS